MWAWLSNLHEVRACVYSTETDRLLMCCVKGFIGTRCPPLLRRCHSERKKRGLCLISGPIRLVGRVAGIMGGGQFGGLLYLELARLDGEGAEVLWALPGLTTNEACAGDLLATGCVWNGCTGWPWVCHDAAAV